MGGETPQLPLFEDMIEVIGVKATIDLCLARGGETVYIPEKIHADHWLAKAVGAEAASILAWTYGRQKLTLPLGPTGSGAQRLRTLREMIAAGASVNEIVRRMRVGRSTVYRHKRAVKSNDGDTSQLKLF